MSGDDKIPIIVDTTAQHLSPAPEDRLGGEQHGLVKWVSGLISTRVDAGKISETLSEASGKLANLLQESFSKKFGDFYIDEFTLNFAVTAEGNIGIATAGVETSVSVVFKHKGGSG